MRKLLVALTLSSLSLTAVADEKELLEVKKQISILKERIDLLGPSKEFSEEMGRLTQREKDLKNGVTPAPTPEEAFKEKKEKKKEEKKKKKKKRK